MSSYTGLTSTTTTYANALSVQSDCLYHLNDTDASGYVFELGALDISDAITVDPSFAELMAGLSGIATACDGVVELDASLVDFQGLFSIQIDSDDVDDVSSTDVKFRINGPGDDTYNDISSGDGSLNVGDFFAGRTYNFSNAIVKNGMINTTYSNQHIKYDFIRHIAKEITGGYNSADIFSNEAALVTAVGSLDSDLNTTLNSTINDISNTGWKDKDYSGSTGAHLMYHAAQNLFKLNLQVGNAATTTRMGQLLDDISGASNKVGANASSINVPLRFSSGDRLAIRIVYHPASATFASNSASISDRSYKVFLKLA